MSTNVLLATKCYEYYASHTAQSCFGSSSSQPFICSLGSRAYNASDVKKHHFSEPQFPLLLVNVLFISDFSKLVLKSN